MEKSEDISLIRTPRKRNPAKKVRIERSQREWQRLIEEAKRKEGFWTKGIIPGSIVLLKDSEEKELDEK